MSNRIVLISDTHGLHDSVSVPQGDILIHAGDCTDDIGQASLRNFLTWFEKQPCPEKILIAGNHDGAFEKWPDLARAMVKEMAPSVHYLQDSAVEINGIKFWGSPYTPEFFDWHFNCKRGEDIARHWNMIPNETDVLVTHGPPFSFLDVSGFKGAEIDGHVGCRDLRDAIYRVEPELHVFGHIHHSYGTTTYIGDLGHKTTLVNASCCDERYRPVNAPFIFEIP